MHQKPDVTPRTPSGIPAEVVPVPSIAETKGLVAEGAHMRMDPRVLSRINNVVSILEQDYAKVLQEHLTDMAKHHSVRETAPASSRDAIHEIAHDIRCVAATFGRPLAGQIATRICTTLDRAPDGVPIIDEHLAALNHVASLTPEPEGAFAILVLKRLDELERDAPTPDQGTASSEEN